MPVFSMPHHRYIHTHTLAYAPTQFIYSYTYIIRKRVKGVIYNIHPGFAYIRSLPVLSSVSSSFSFPFSLSVYRFRFPTLYSLLFIAAGECGGRRTATEGVAGRSASTSSPCLPCWQWGCFAPLSLAGWGCHRSVPHLDPGDGIPRGGAGDGILSPRMPSLSPARGTASPALQMGKAWDWACPRLLRRAAPLGRFPHHGRALAAPAPSPPATTVDRTAATATIISSSANMSLAAKKHAAQPVFFSR